MSDIVPGYGAYYAAHQEIERLRAIIEHQQSGMNNLAIINAELLAALEILAGNDLNETNCASVEVAAKRVRNIARAALAGAKP